MVRSVLLDAPWARMNTVFMNSIIRYEPTQVKLTLPYVLSTVPAGFPSPAADYIQSRLSTDDLLIHDPISTYFIRAKGDSMRDAGISDGDILVVNSAMEAVDGDVVVAVIDGAFTVKRLKLKSGQAELHAENNEVAYPVLKPLHELQILGVVTSNVHIHRAKPGLKL